MPFAPVEDVAPDVWDPFVEAHPGSHFLQTSAWGALKSRFGWEAQRTGITNGSSVAAGAQVLYRRLPGGLGKLAYVPRGPLVDWSNETQVQALIARLVGAARAHGAIALTLEPDLPDSAARREQLSRLGLRPAPITIQPPRTLIVDISRDEDAILGSMKSKTRYNIRLAARKGVAVRAATRADLPAFQKLMSITGSRDRFDVHSAAYYEAAYDLFAPRGWATVLLAEVEGAPVAAVMVFALSSMAWYIYGASSNAHRNKMPTYLLQWEAMRWARSRGCTSYDLWGIPDTDEDRLESEFTTRSDGLWGVYRFKRGFGGQLLRTVGAWDWICAPVRYRAYRALLTLRRRLTR